MAKKQNPCIYTIALSEDEAYTLQILLGTVAADNEVYNISKKLVQVTGDEPQCEDYERLEFYYNDFTNEDGKPKLVDTTTNEMIVKIK